jgi:fatty acid desaturase
MRQAPVQGRGPAAARRSDYAELSSGLNYQIEHHLFPSMPRPNLRHAQAPVQAFCAKHGIPYAPTSLLDSYAQVLRHLNTVGGAVRP